MATAIRPRLPRTIIALGLVSLFNDAASEAIYPLLPAFLASLGAGPAALGVIEGIAEATASLLKLISGVIADRVGKLRALTFAGYCVAIVLRPLMGLTHAWTQVLAIRFGDRVGKGIRTTARDALLAAATPEGERGRAFGFHRAMDNVGAVAGPLLAYALLAFGLSVRQVFLWTIVPGAFALIALVRGVKGNDATPARSPGILLGLPPSRTYRRLLLALILFALGNSSDAFLLWRAREVGIAPALLPLLWIVLNVVKAALSTLGGTMSDRIGRRRPILLGWAIYAGVYVGFGFARATWHVWVLMACYGLYFALTEGVEKAWVVDVVPTAWRARALGTYHAALGFASLPASAGFGLLYRALGPAVAFGAGAALAACAALLLPSGTRHPTGAA